MCDCLYSDAGCEECKDLRDRIQQDVADMGEDPEDHSDDLDVARFEGEGGSSWSV